MPSINTISTDTAARVAKEYGATAAIVDGSRFRVYGPAVLGNGTYVASIQWGSVILQDGQLAASAMA